MPVERAQFPVECEGLGFGVWGLGFGVWGLGFHIEQAKGSEVGGGGCVLEQSIQTGEEGGGYGCNIRWGQMKEQ